MADRPTPDTGIITGDIVNSRQYSSSKWLVTLKEALNQYGREPQQWEIYRGDSFQLEVPPKQALEAVLYLKACIKQYKNLDARLAIGIGTKNPGSIKITEANGSAFVNSGECFENLNKRTLAIRTPWQQLDEEINLYLQLALLTIDRWGPTASYVIKSAILYPGLTQKELSKKIGKSQSSISETLTRAGFEEIMLVEKRFRKLITNR